jgi:hypothetical protein
MLLLPFPLSYQGGKRGGGKEIFHCYQNRDVNDFLKEYREKERGGGRSDKKREKGAGTKELFLAGATNPGQKLPPLPPLTSAVCAPNCPWRELVFIMTEKMSASERLVKSVRT